MSSEAFPTLDTLHLTVQYNYAGVPFVHLCDLAHVARVKGWETMLIDRIKPRAFGGVLWVCAYDAERELANLQTRSKIG